MLPPGGFSAKYPAFSLVCGNPGFSKPWFRQPTNDGLCFVAFRASSEKEWPGAKMHKCFRCRLRMHCSKMRQQHAREDPTGCRADALNPALFLDSKQKLHPICTQRRTEADQNLLLFDFCNDNPATYHHNNAKESQHAGDCSSFKRKAVEKACKKPSENDAGNCRTDAD